VTGDSSEGVATAAATTAPHLGFWSIVWLALKGEQYDHTADLEAAQSLKESRTMKTKSPRDVAASLPELWSPRVIGEVDDAYIKVARIHGAFTWHAHADEDELFYILKGSMRIELERETVELREGDMYIVPKGVRHNPSADEECCVLLIERKSTKHTGDVVTAQARSIAEQLRPV
jgi:mannose-6-phosphate isomerase-like protein (cupin superfamily)